MLCLAVVKQRLKLDNMAEFDFKGLCAATFTPMKQNGDINASVIPEYASYLARNQINGVYVNGTTGEGMYSLTFDERKRIAEGWLSEKSKIPTVIIQVGGCSFREAQQLAAHAEQHGATAIGILASMYVSPRNIDELVEWVRRIAEAAPNTPCLYYHIPKFTHLNLSMVDFLKEGVKRIPTLAGLKFTSRDLAEAGDCLLHKRSNGKPFHFLFGSDETYLGHYAFGLESAIGSSYNFAPQLFHGINKAVADNDIAEARRLQLVVTKMFAAVFKNGNPGLVQQKVAMKILTGIDLGPGRFPQHEMSLEHIKELEHDLQHLDIGQFHV